ncbi:uncharacterized protein ACR2FA_004022 [Aphomia sociella]
MHNFGLGKRIPDLHRLFNGHEYPKSLPSTKLSPISYMRSFENIYQGTRGKSDKRVYRRRFDYEPQLIGHHVICEGSFNCKLTHIAVETKGGIPILLRGGAGYNYFKVVTKAAAGNQLSGTIVAYCSNGSNAYYKENAQSRYNYNKYEQ